METLVFVILYLTLGRGFLMGAAEWTSPGL